jgi:branched-chain amino acid transport system permease protein
MSLLVASMVIGGIALSWALLGNLGGMISFGHAAFFGVGAYTSAVLSMKFGVPVLLPAAGRRRCIDCSTGDAAGAAPARSVFRAGDPGLRPHLPHPRHGMEFDDRRRGRLSNIPALPTVLGLDLSSKIGAYFVILLIVALFALAYSAAARQPLRHRPARHARERGRHPRGRRQQHRAQGHDAAAVGLHGGVVGAFNAHYINFLEPDYAFSALWVTIPIVAAIFGGYRTSRAGGGRRGGLPAGPAGVQVADPHRASAGAGRAAGGDDRLQSDGLLPLLQKC